MGEHWLANWQPSKALSGRTFSSPKAQPGRLLKAMEITIGQLALGAKRCPRALRDIDSWTNIWSIWPVSVDRGI